MHAWRSVSLSLGATPTQRAPRISATTPNGKALCVLFVAAPFTLTTTKALGDMRL